MATKKEKGALYVRGFPSGLLGRINGTAEYLEIDRNEFVIELLRQDMEMIETLQTKAKEWWASRKEPRDGPTE